MKKVSTKRRPAAGRGQRAAQPTDAEFESYVEVVDKVLSNPSTRVAWLMGFLTGSALSDGESPDAAMSHLLATAAPRS